MVAVFLLVGGCGDDGQGTEDDAGASYDAEASAVDAPVAVDASSAVDAAPSVDAAAPSPVTFRLTFAPKPPGPPIDAIYVEYACGQMWVRVLDGDGNAVRIDSDCGICSCDTCEDCAVCDCALLIEQIPADSSRDHAWDGITHPSKVVDGCGVCEYASTLPAGTYTARFCYSFSEWGPLVCGDESFDYPSATLVEHVVEGPP